VSTLREPRVLFLGGIGRSGTTLLELALGQHADAVVLGETLHLWRRGVVLDERCSCGQPFSACEFWREVGEVAFGGWSVREAEHVEELRRRVDRIRRLPLLASRSLRGPDAAAVLEYAGYFRAIHRAAAEVTGSSVVVDASKQITLAFCLSHLPGSDLAVLHCVRDSRAVAHAWTKVVQRPDSDDPTAQMRRYPPTRLAGLWDAHNAAVGLLRSRRGVPVLRSRYEDFAGTPEATVLAVAAFAGLSPDGFPPGSLGPDWVTIGGAHTVSGNPVRFSTGRTLVRRDDRWRTAMPARQQAGVTALTWPLLWRYGYPLRVGGASAD